MSLSDTSQLIQFAQQNKISLTQAHIQLAAQESQIIRAYLKNGIGLTSPVIANDEDFLLLEDRKGGLNLVNTEAVATVQTLRATDTSDIKIDTNLPLVDAALEKLRVEAVHVFLINGVRLDGFITDYDKEDLALTPMQDSHGGMQIVRWNSVASIQRFDRSIANRVQRY